MTFNLEKAKGYDPRGKHAQKSYMACIDGLSTAYGFSRTFLEPDDIDWGVSQLYKRSKGTWTEHYGLGPGLLMDDGVEYEDARRQTKPRAAS